MQSAVHKYKPFLKILFSSVDEILIRRQKIEKGEMSTPGLWARRF
jgi:hypothetical protein